MSIELMLVDKYHPETINDMVLDDTIKEKFKEFVYKKKTIPHLLLAGRAGLGKTTLAKLITKELNATVKYIPCAEKKVNVDYVKNVVSDFCNMMNTNQEVPKIVIMDEADCITGGDQEGGSSGMTALKNVITSNQDDTRFILTCNAINKISPPVQSRCTPINLRFNKQDVAKRVIEILKKENIKFSIDTIKEFTNVVIKNFFPDVRSIIANLEFWIKDGVLVNTGVSEINEASKIAEEILLKLKKNPTVARKFYIENEDKFGTDYEKLSGLIFNMFEKNVKVQILIGEHLYRMAMVLDKEINFYAMLLQIKEFIK